jgi:pimeloyl-ACP methyl ester carboxylesterase
MQRQSPRLTRKLWVRAVATLITVLTVSTGRATGIDHREPRLPAIPCTALGQFMIPDAIITSAVNVAASGSVPAYCRVLATVAPETDIEVRLPENWQQRLLHLGGSGLDGVIPNLNLNGAQLAAGYALAASNGGHRDATGGPTRFLNNPVLIEDYAFAAIGKTVRFAKAAIQAYYAQEAIYAYFAGCSNGGRGAFNAAAKYPDEYDGVIAGAPGRNVPGLISGWVRAGLLTPPSAAKMASLYRAELAQCDATDGLADGIISNPRACRFDPATIGCPAGVDNDSCLTDTEIQAVNTIRSDLELANGKLVYSRLGIGNPAKGFGVFMPLGPPGSPTVASFGAAYLQYIVYSDPAYDPATYDVDRDLRTVVRVMEGVYDFSAGTVPLAKYLRSGKKMIVWHGTEDTAVSHLDTIRTYKKMADAADEGAENARLYTPPGVLHCGGGPGADRFDVLGAMTDWVEDGRAPRTLLAAKVNSTGSVLFTRPLCEYPRYPRYIGHGDPNDASSFECVGWRRKTR